MLLATTRVEDFDRFMKVFSAGGAEKRKQHGSKGAMVYRDPAESDRVWVAFDWDEHGWQKLPVGSDSACRHEGGRPQDEADRGDFRRPLRRVSPAR